MGDPNFDLVFRGRDALQAVHSKSTMDLLNLESVFAAFEMAKLLRRLGTLSVEEVDALPGAMTRVIQQTLETTIRFPISEGRVRPPRPYADIGELLTQRNKQASQSTFSFITFNYDFCLDFALYMKGLRIDYCLGPPVQNAVKLLKLHGSLNWSQCPKCKQIVAYRVEEYFQNVIPLSEAGSAKIIISSGLGRIPHCDVTLSSHPFIAPPTWNKTQYHTQLESVWRAAATELSEAESIVICGYSLPETDQFFRYLYALGAVGGSGLRKFWVINPDPSLESRFRALCGPLALSRFKYIPTIVEQSIPTLSAALD
jgi:hypothetical protein